MPKDYRYCIGCCLVVLGINSSLEEKIEKLWDFRIYTVTTALEDEKIESVKATFLSMWTSGQILYYRQDG